MKIDGTKKNPRNLTKGIICFCKASMWVSWEKEIK